MVGYVVSHIVVVLILRALFLTLRALFLTLRVVTDTLAKANILNDPFTSAFTVDNDGSNQIPALKVPPSPTIQPIHIEAQGICTLTLLSELDDFLLFHPLPIPEVTHLSYSNLFQN